jgi:hypothetical protein
MRTVRTLAIICLLALPLGAQTTTPNIGLEVPVTGGPNWQVQLNFNWNLLDTLLSDVPHAGGYVSSIDTQKGAFTFTGPGVSHTGNAYTFSGSGTGIGSIAWTLPSFLTASPTTISASGTQTLGLATQAANLVFAGPSSGSAVAPTFRALVVSDIPSGLNYQAPLGFTAVPNTRQVAGHALSADVTVNASDLAVGALPNGTAATTQAAGDSTTKIATDAFVLGQGVGGRTVSGSTDTISSADRGQSVLYTATAAVSLPDPSTLGGNFVFVASARSAAGIIVTFTAAAGTFLNSSGGTATTLVITSGQTCSISTPDNTNYLARCGAARHLAGYTVSTLPSASSLGAEVMVTDASTFTVGTCTGGGSDVMIAVSSGSAWSCH